MDWARAKSAAGRMAAVGEIEGVGAQAAGEEEWGRAGGIVQPVDDGFAGRVELFSGKHRLNFCLTSLASALELTAIRAEVVPRAPFQPAHFLPRAGDHWKRRVPEPMDFGRGETG